MKRASSNKLTPAAMLKLDHGPRREAEQLAELASGEERLDAHPAPPGGGATAARVPLRSPFHPPLTQSHPGAALGGDGSDSQGSAVGSGPGLRTGAGNRRTRARTARPALQRCTRRRAPASPPATA